MWAAAAAVVIGASSVLVPLAVPAWTPTAAADACVHRGAGHWDRHGGLEDDRFHESHGELPTCHDPDDGHHHDEDIDEPGEPHAGEHHDDRHEEHPGDEHADEHHGDEHHDGLHAPHLPGHGHEGHGHHRL